MSSNKLWQMLSFRLVLWYTGVFFISSCIAFSACYFLVARRLDRIKDEELTMELEEYRNLYRDGGLEALRDEIQLETETEEPDHTYFRILSMKGEVIYSTDTSFWPEMAPVEESLSRLRTGERFIIGTLPRLHLDYPVSYLYGVVGDGLVADFGLSRQDDEEFLAAFRKILGGGLLAMTLVSGLIGWFMSRRALRGVEEVTRTAMAIQKGGGLDRRVPLKSRGLEIETLAITFNQMIDHIEALINEMRELTDNIAHELRNPITAIRGRSELALINGSPDELVGAAAGAVADCDELLSMINDMLDLAEAGAGALRLDRRAVPLARLFADAEEIFEPLAQEKGIRLEISAADTIVVEADRRGLQRILTNLLDNAIKYTPSGGRVTLSARRSGAMVRIDVSDTGIGISPADQPQIFRRFFRADQSRSEAGTGLGLSLARAIARAHGGDIEFNSSESGSVFTVTLPA